MKRPYPTDGEALFTGGDRSRIFTSVRRHIRAAYADRWLIAIGPRWENAPRRKRSPIGDEVWSFVGSKQRQKRIWLAINRDTRAIDRVAIGARVKATARKRWAALPAVDRQCAVCYTDFWQAYATILPSKRQRAAGKERGQTCHIERRATRFGNAGVGWYAKRARSRKRALITSAHAGIKHGLFRTARHGLDEP